MASSRPFARARLPDEGAVPFGSRGGCGSSRDDMSGKNRSRATGARSAAGRPAREGQEPDARAVEENRRSLQRRISDWLDLPLAVLALIWTGLVVVELAFTLPPGVSQRILQVDFAIWLVFALVFFTEFFLAPDKLGYLRSNPLTALAVLLPFTRAVRLIRLAAVLRSISLVRLVTVTNRATVAIAEIFSENQFHRLLPGRSPGRAPGARGGRSRVHHPPCR